MKLLRVTKKAIAAAVLSGSITGLGAGVAEAAPMERDHKKYCAKINSDMDITGRIYIDYRTRFGSDNRLTLQAASNFDRAVDAFMASSC
ncbi:MAG: hypothetical protein ACKV2O_10125 [Acidimicrobiales bacterium]